MARRGLRDTLLVAWGLRIVEGVVSTSWRLRRYLLRRVMSSAVSVVGAVILTFLFLHLIPGDPVDNLLGDDARPQDKIELRQCLDLDQPLPVQFGRFVRSIFDGTMGYSCPDRKTTVAARVTKVLPSTVALSVAAMAVAVPLALLIGVAAALKVHTRWDALLTGIALLGISLPAMWLGPMLLNLFYVQLQILPGPGEDTGRLRGLFLPAVMLGTHLMAMLARMTRSSMIETLSEDYIRTARAKGLPTWKVVFKHALRNALLPVITVAGMQFGALLAGAVVTEKVFARPGLGTLLLEGIAARDYRIVQGCTLVIAGMYVAVNLLVDVVYAAVDPRIRV
ncbi:MAG TPA: ABC transporter permease [Pseudomonadota bacterium]|nr:ABC transporter permease [Pseudomonadota bacterium]